MCSRTLPFASPLDMVESEGLPCEMQLEPCETLVITVFANIYAETLLTVAADKRVTFRTVFSTRFTFRITSIEIAHPYRRRLISYCLLDP